MRTKKVMMNIFFSMLDKISIMISGFIISNIVISSYGSDMNGLISSVKQFIVYLSVFDLGIAGAAIYELYEPLSKKNYAKVNKILSGVKKFYNKLGIICVLATIAFCLFYVQVTRGKGVDESIIYFVFMIFSINRLTDFFVLSKYKVLFTANQSEYLVHISSVLYTLVYTILFVVFAKLNFSITIAQSAVLIAMGIRVMVTTLFYKRRYKQITYDLDDSSINVGQKKEVFAHQICILINSSLVMFYMTISNYEFTEISVFSVNNLVVGGVLTLLLIFNSAIKSGFGDLLVKKEYARFTRTYHMFEFGYFTICSIVFVCVSLLLRPFIELYTANVSDVVYTNDLLVIVLISVAILNCLKEPMATIVNAMGLYKKTLKIIVGGTIISIATSFIVMHLGYEYVIITSGIVYMVIFVGYTKIISNMKMGYRLSYTIKALITAILSFVLSYIFCKMFISYDTDTYLYLILSAIKTGVCAVFIHMLCAMVLNNSYCLLLLNHFKKIICRK